MKKIVTIIIAIAFVSCDRPVSGTIKNIDTSPNDEIQVFRYYYADGEWVYVARFNDQPKTTTTTWTERHGKTTVTKCSVSKGDTIIFE